MSLRFTKMHGIGNDFVVLDRRAASAPLSDELVRRLADRHFGIGCDQVMTIEGSEDGDSAFRYGIYNADGSRAGQCGNGLRCVVRWLADRGLVRGQGIHLHGPSGPVRVEVLDNGQIRADMGMPEFEAARVPIAIGSTQPHYSVDIDGEPIRFGAVSMGNPHVVIAVDDLDATPVARLGARLESHALFPDRANIGFVQVLAPDHVRLRVFERGVGETLACGSGACAAVAVLRLWNKVDTDVRVELPGGSLTVSWAGMGQPIWMTGPATTVFEGEWNDE